MIRPAERFTVNVRDGGPAPRLARATPRAIPRPSTGTVVVVAAALGTGIGGLLPAAWAPDPSPPELAAALPAAAPDLAGIEPAAGPAGGAMVVARAPDRAFYVPVFLDEVALTMRLEPGAARTSLSAHDAGRLAAGSDRAAGVPVGEVRLGSARLGPVSLPVDATGLSASVLGADLLDRLAVVAVDGERLRLTPR